MTCISSGNAFISTWHKIFKDASFGLLGARVIFEILLSIAQSHYSGLLKFPGGSASQLFIAHIDLDLASLGTVINILLEKAFRKGCVTLVWKWGFLWFQCLRFESCWCQPMVTVTIYYASHFQNRWPYSGQFPLFTIHLACTLDSRPFIKAIRVAVH